jgi:hypothetical protein
LTPPSLPPFNNKNNSYNISNNFKQNYNIPWVYTGGWNHAMKKASSNKKELVAIHKVIQKSLPVLKNENKRSIHILTDNTTALYNINR